MSLSAAQLLGQDDSHVQQGADGHSLHPQCRQALERLQARAAQAGFKPAVVSGFRSFERQRQIWNAKACGKRPVLDDNDQALDISDMDEVGLVHTIMRFSALPGGSRHHWGGDLDVYDAAAVPADYQVQLNLAEVSDTGVFGAFHQWLDELIEADDAEGFFRPYAQDRGGVSPERWHLSYAPLANECVEAFSESLLNDALQRAELSLQATVLRLLPELYPRYIAPQTA